MLRCPTSYLHRDSILILVTSHKIICSNTNNDLKIFFKMLFSRATSNLLPCLPPRMYLSMVTDVINYQSCRLSGEKWLVRANG